MNNKNERKILKTFFEQKISLISFQTMVNGDGTLSFDCQHGPTECDANMYHACTIESIRDQNKLVNMIACMIANNYNPKEALLSCCHSLNVEYEEILKCFQSRHGEELLKLHGDLTNSLRPEVTFIPTITLDGSRGRQESILKDLFGEVCKVAAAGGPMPAVCANDD